MQAGLTWWRLRRACRLQIVWLLVRKLFRSDQMRSRAICGSICKLPRRVLRCAGCVGKAHAYLRFLTLSLASPGWRDKTDFTCAQLAARGALCELRGWVYER